MLPFKYLAGFMRIHYAVSWFFFWFLMKPFVVARFLYNFFLNSLKVFFPVIDISMRGKIFMLFKICVFFLN